MSHRARGVDICVERWREERAERREKCGRATHLVHLAEHVLHAVDDRERATQALGVRGGARHARRVPRDHHGAQQVHVLLQVLQEERARAQVVHRHLEEALHLLAHEHERREGATRTSVGLSKANASATAKIYVYFTTLLRYCKF